MLDLHAVALAAFADLIGGGAERSEVIDTLRCLVPTHVSGRRKMLLDDYIARLVFDVSAGTTTP